MRRSQLTVKGLGRFGLYAPFEEDMTIPPCDPKLSDTNRVCAVHLIGRGLVKITVADKSLYGAGNVRKDAVVAVEYPADCENEKFDFKTMDNVLPRKGNVGGTLQVWEDRLIVVTHEKKGEGKEATCSVVVASSPEFVKRLSVPTGIKFKGDPFATP